MIVLRVEILSCIFEVSIAIIRCLRLWILLLYMVSQIMQRLNTIHTSTVHIFNIAVVSVPTGLGYSPVPPCSRAFPLFGEQQLRLWHTLLGTSLTAARSLSCFVSDNHLSATLASCDHGAQTTYIFWFPSDDVG